MSSAIADLQRHANRRWSQNRRRLKALGKWQPFVDAPPVRERVRDLNQAGMPNGALTARLDLPPGALDHLMCKRGGEYSREVRTETAEAVMGYWPTLDDFPAGSLIDATGTHRRFQALTTLGWTQLAIAGRMGVPNRSLSRALSKPRVTAGLARQMARVYDEVWSRRPAAHEVTAAGAHQARMHAQARGLNGPLAWDDDTIDDPSALPMTDASEPTASEGGNLAARWLMGESVILDCEARREVLTHLYEWTNETTADIAARLDMTPAAAERQWERIKQRAQADGVRLWRRVYMPRDRDLKQNEMGEAA